MTKLGLTVESCATKFDYGSGAVGAGYRLEPAERWLSNQLSSIRLLEQSASRLDRNIMASSSSIVR